MYGLIISCYIFPVEERAEETEVVDENANSLIKEGNLLLHKLVPLKVV